MFKHILQSEVAQEKGQGNGWLTCRSMDGVLAAAVVFLLVDLEGTISADVFKFVISQKVRLRLALSGTSPLTAVFLAGELRLCFNVTLGVTWLLVTRPLRL
jgi:hypothetical protein